MGEGQTADDAHVPEGAGYLLDVPAGHKRTEVGVIPKDWEVRTVGDLFAFKNGLNKAKRYFGAGTPIVNYMDVFERPGLTPGDLSGRVSLTSDEIKNYQVQKGDVFFTRTSETAEEVGVASVMLESPRDTVFSGTRPSCSTSRRSPTRIAISDSVLPPDSSDPRLSQGRPTPPVR